MILPSMILPIPFFDKPGAKQRSTSEACPQDYQSELINSISEKNPPKLPNLRALRG
jgi:hypothetical protein